MALSEENYLLAETQTWHLATTDFSRYFLDRTKRIHAVSSIQSFPLTVPVTRPLFGSNLIRRTFGACLAAPNRLRSWPMLLSVYRVTRERASTGQPPAILERYSYVG
jgi:hypothetical protein